MYSNTCKKMLNYSYKYTYNYMIILIRIHVSIQYQNCGLSTCKNEKCFYDYYNEFEYNHDLVAIVFNKNMIL